MKRFLNKSNKKRTNPGAQVAAGALLVRDRVWAVLRAIAWRLFGALPYALIAAVVALTPVAIVYGYRYVTQAPEFGARDVSVSGHERVSAQELLEVAGVEHAPNLLALDLREVEARLVEHPWVRTAKVERRLPDRLSIKVTEQKPAAQVALGALYLLDRQGNVFKRVESDEHFDLPVITGLSKADLNPEGNKDRYELSQRLLRGGLKLLSTWRGSALGKGITVSEVNVDPLFGYSLVLGRGSGAGTGAVVRVGLRDVGERLARLVAVLTDAERRGKRVLEVRLNDERDPTRVAVRFEPTANRVNEDEGGAGPGSGDRAASDRRG